MKILNTLKPFLKGNKSFFLGSYQINLRISKKYSPKVDALYLENFYERQVEYLIAKFPELKRITLSPRLFSYEELFNLFIQIVPALGGIASEVHIRNTLSDLKNSCDDASKSNELANEIARSNLRCGIPERAIRLKHDLTSGSELERQVRSLNEAYGFRVADNAWPYSSRGEALVYFFKSHPEKIKSKKILHLSPEPELKIFFENLVKDSAIIYHTSNLLGENLDYLQDLTAMTFQDETYDLIICHRVLEHILDDMSALSEINRCLKVGGTLNISVPQSLHVENTLDWIIPDKTHHEHVRQYGSDFSQRLASAGFNVVVNNWLLEISEEDLRLNQIYPLRFYEAVKLGSS